MKQDSGSKRSSFPLYVYSNFVSSALWRRLASALRRTTSRSTTSSTYTRASSASSRACRLCTLSTRPRRAIGVRSLRRQRRPRILRIQGQVMVGQLAQCERFGDTSRRHAPVHGAPLAKGARRVTGDAKKLGDVERRSQALAEKSFWPPSPMAGNKGPSSTTASARARARVATAWPSISLRRDSQLALAPALRDRLALGRYEAWRAALRRDFRSPGHGAPNHPATSSAPTSSPSRHVLHGTIAFESHAN